MYKLLRDFGPALDKIEELKKPTRLRLIHRGALNAKDASIRRSKSQGFEVEVNGLTRNTIVVGDELQFKTTAPYELKITSAYCRALGAKSSRSLKMTHTLSVRAMEKNVRKKRAYYCRTVLSISEDIPFYYMIDAMPYYHPRGSKLGMIKVSLIQRDDYTVYCYTRDKKFYLIIDSETKKTPDIFDEECWSILVSLGYIQGYLPQDEEYSFYYTAKTNSLFSAFGYRTLRNSLKSIYKPLYSNPFAWSIPKKEANRYYKILRNLSQKQFAALCQWTHKENDIKAILLLIVEATKGSLLMMPAGLSVALEGLTEYFYEENKEVLQPITNKSTSRKLVQELKVVLSKYEMHPDVQDYGILSVKIEQLNAPTNADKLKAPFAILDIPLSEIDKETIDYRNDFLHGNINLKPRKGKKTYSMSDFEIALRLYTLLSAIILKKIGYDSFILNHVKLQEGGVIKNIKEPHYRSLTNPPTKPV